MYSENQQPSEKRKSLAAVIDKIIDLARVTRKVDLSQYKHQLEQAVLSVKQHIAELNSTPPQSCSIPNNSTSNEIELDTKETSPLLSSIDEIQAFSASNKGRNRTQTNVSNNKNNNTDKNIPSFNIDVVRKDTPLLIAHVCVRLMRLNPSLQDIYDTQLCAIVSLVMFDVSLLQLFTGGGKTFVIGITACVLALQQDTNRIHIATSNAELSKRDAEILKSLFDSFNLVSAVVDSNTARGIHNIHVLFGTLHNLRGSFLDLDPKNPPVFSHLIIDEVDAEAGDGVGSATLLSALTYGTECLFPVYGVFKTMVVQAMTDDESEFCPGRLREALYNSMKSNEPGVGLLKSTLKNFFDRGDSFLGKEIDDPKTQIEGMTEDALNEKMIPIPDCLDPVIDFIIPVLIESVIQAFERFQKNVSFVPLSKGGIRPVDVDSTGMVQVDQVLSNGIHQFLSILHNQPLAAESYLGRFMSAPSMYRYYHRVCGLSGTLGSESNVRFLHDLFEKYRVKNCTEKDEDYQQGWFSELVNRVSFSSTSSPQADLQFPRAIEICRVKDSKLKDQGSLLCDDDVAFRTSVIDQILEAADTRNSGINRPVLFLTDTVDDVNAWNNILALYDSSQQQQQHQQQQQSPSDVPRIKSIFPYARNDEAEFPKDRLFTPGEVVISTKLAGRGVDPKIDEQCKEQGGFHLIDTSISSSSRHDAQKIGRVARNGDPGSCIRIFDLSRCNFACADENSTCVDFSDLVHRRDLMESINLIVTLECSVPKNICQDAFELRVRQAICRIRGAPSEGNIKTKLTLREAYARSATDLWSRQLFIMQAFETRTRFNQFMKLHKLISPHGFSAESVPSAVNGIDVCTQCDDLCFQSNLRYQKEKMSDEEKIGIRASVLIEHMMKLAKSGSTSTPSIHSAVDLSTVDGEKHFFSMLSCSLRKQVCVVDEFGNVDLFKCECINHDNDDDDDDDDENGESMWMDVAVDEEQEEEEEEDMKTKEDKNDDDEELKTATSSSKNNLASETPILFAKLSDGSTLKSLDRSCIPIMPSLVDVFYPSKKLPALDDNHAESLTPDNSTPSHLPKTFGRIKSVSAEQWQHFLAEASSTSLSNNNTNNKFNITHHDLSMFCCRDRILKKLKADDLLELEPSTDIDIALREILQEQCARQDESKFMAPLVDRLVTCLNYFAPSETRDAVDSAAKSHVALHAASRFMNFVSRNEPAITVTPISLFELVLDRVFVNNNDLFETEYDKTRQMYPESLCALSYTKAYQMTLLKKGTDSFQTIIDLFQATHDEAPKIAEPMRRLLLLCPSIENPSEEEGSGKDSFLLRQIALREQLANQLQQNCQHNIEILKDGKSKEKHHVVLAQLVSCAKDNSINDDDRTEVATRLVSHFFTVDVKPNPPTKWELFGLALLGIGQIIAGALLTCSGYGSTIGRWLINQGCNDLVTVAKTSIALLRGEDVPPINWGDYWKNKAISLGVCVGCAFAKSVAQCWKAVSKAQDLGKIESSKSAFAKTFSKEVFSKETVKSTFGVGGDAGTFREVLKEGVKSAATNIVAGEVVNYATSKVTTAAVSNWRASLSSEVITLADDDEIVHGFVCAQVTGKLPEAHRTISKKLDTLTKESWFREYFTSISTTLCQQAESTRAQIVSRAVVAGVDASVDINDISKLKSRVTGIIREIFSSYISPSAATMALRFSAADASLKKSRTIEWFRSVADKGVSAGLFTHDLSFSRGSQLDTFIQQLSAAGKDEKKRDQVGGEIVERCQEAVPESVTEQSLIRQLVFTLIDSYDNPSLIRESFEQYGKFIGDTLESKINKAVGRHAGAFAIEQLGESLKGLWDRLDGTKAVRDAKEQEIRDKQKQLEQELEAEKQRQRNNNGKSSKSNDDDGGGGGGGGGCGGETDKNNQSFEDALERLSIDSQNKKNNNIGDDDLDSTATKTLKNIINKHNLSPQDLQQILKENLFNNAKAELNELQKTLEVIINEKGGAKNVSKKSWLADTFNNSVEYLNDLKQKYPKAYERIIKTAQFAGNAAQLAMLVTPQGAVVAVGAQLVKGYIRGKVTDFVVDQVVTNSTWIENPQAVKDLINDVQVIAGGVRSARALKHIGKDVVSNVANSPKSNIIKNTTKNQANNNSSNNNKSKNTDINKTNTNTNKSTSSSSTTVFKHQVSKSQNLTQRYSQQMKALENKMKAFQQLAPKSGNCGLRPINSNNINNSNLSFNRRGTTFKVHQVNSQSRPPNYTNNAFSKAPSAQSSKGIGKTNNVTTNNNNNSTTINPSSAPKFNQKQQQQNQPPKTVQPNVNKGGSNKTSSNVQVSTQQGATQTIKVLSAPANPKSTVGIGLLKTQVTCNTTGRVLGTENVLKIRISKGASGLTKLTMNRKMAYYRNAIRDQCLKKTPMTASARGGGAQRKHRAAIFKKNRTKTSLPNKTDADHFVDLQLGGVDGRGNIGLACRRTNRSVGSQLRHRLKHLKNGEQIHKIEVEYV